MGRPAALRCLHCGTRAAAWPPPPACPACRTPEFASNLVCEYGETGAGAPGAGLTSPGEIRRLASLPGGVWRFAPLLPDVGAPVTMGEGDTPLVRLARLGANLGLASLWLKDESQNPTWSFKDRLCSVAVSVAASHAAPGIVAASTGNHGASTAAYAARAGLPCIIFATPTAPPTIVTLMQAYGAMVVIVPTSEDRWRMVGACVEGWGWFSTTNSILPPVGSTPYGLEGYKTIAYEVAAALDWEVPDVFIIPVSNGDGLIGIWSGFQDLLACGAIARLPRLIAAEPYPAYSEALLVSPHRLITVPRSQSVAFNVGTGAPTYQGLAALRESGGEAVVVDDDTALAMQRRVAGTEGMYAEVSSVISVAAAAGLVAARRLPSDARVVCLSTSSGLKDPGATAKTLPPAPVIEPDLTALGRALAHTYGFSRRSDAVRSFRRTQALHLGAGRTPRRDGGAGEEDPP
ncbi:MAG: pyridoxal-phosphate dependent enzyme [bacterium]